MARARIRLRSGAVALSVGALTVVGGVPGTADGAGATGTRAAPATHHSGPTCGGVRPRKPGGGRYKCTFTDDFKGSRLSSSKWMIGTTESSGMTTRAGGCYLADRDNVSVGGGTLKLTARVESEPFFCQDRRGGFWTRQSVGSVVSWSKFAQTYGRFEFRAKFPKTSAPGIDSALWMYPKDPAYGRWPRSGEIDVAERFGDAHGDHVYPSVHYQGRGTEVDTGEDCRVAGSDTSFHTYAVEWTTSTMSFYYDDKLCFKDSWNPAFPLVAPQPFDKAFDLVMTQTGGAPGPDAPAGSKNTMSIDWVRAWR